MKRICLQCGEEFEKPAWYGKGLYCSKTCSGLASKAKPNLVCTHCGKEFHMRKSQQVGSRSLGFFCSNVCLSKVKSTQYLGEKNPNFKGRNHDQDGYRLYVPSASSVFTGGRKIKLHTAVCCEVLGVKSITGFHIHHRDCNVENNQPENLVVLTASDHKWLHQQFGNATLWAYMHKKISLQELVSWADDRIRAAKLLPMSVLEQAAEVIGVVKEGELRGSLEKGNPQPSYLSNEVEGSETSSRVLLNVEDGNAATSALHAKA